MKKTNQKRIDLINLVNGKKSLAELSLESVHTLFITGTTDSPVYWIGARQVEDTEFSKCLNFLESHRSGVIIDWSTDEKLDILITASLADPHPIIHE